MTNFRPLRKRSKNMLRLQNVQKKDRDLLWNINQKYLYEMTNFYDDPMDAIVKYHDDDDDDYDDDDDGGFSPPLVYTHTHTHTHTHVHT